MPRHPYIAEGICYPAASAAPIAIGTPAWAAWVAAQTVFAYRDAPLSFTARREERPGGVYWYAYRRVGGKLRKRYLGRGDDLTPERFQEVARALLDPHEQPAPPPEAPALIATRFAIPRSASAWVPRPQLLQRFSRAIEHACTIISAPAGSGKTTLLAMGCEQLRAQGWRIAWLSLEPSEQDPASFWLYVLTAIERAIPDAASAALRSLRSSALPSTEALLTPLINALAEQPAQLLLVLDDYHLAATATIDADLLFLIQHLPPALRLVLVSRSEPALPLARLRVQGLLAELRQDELRFSADEAASFFEQTMRLQLAPEQIAALDARTEGWVAGLQLAALSLRGQADVAATIVQFAGSNRYIGEYLMGEVIAGQPSDIQDFLLRTAILPRMCASLCDAITGRGDGQATLERIAAANLFVISLDPEQRWYRYHHLFAEMLCERLASQDPAQLAACHERAAQWFAAHGDLRDAIEHALAAPSYALAASLIETEADLMLQRGETATVLAWFRALPPDTLNVHPHLALSAILALLMNGEIASATATLQQLEAALPASPNDALAGELTAVRALMALMTGGDTNLAMELADEALQRLPQAPGIARDMASLLHGATQVLWQKDPAGVLQILTQTAQSSMRNGNYLVAAFALENRALKEIAQGRLHQAERTCQEVLRMAMRDSQELPFASLAHLRLGDIYREWNQIERARASLEHGIAHGFMLSHPEIMVDGSIALARIYALLGDRMRAQERLDALDGFLQTGQLMPHTAWQVAACRARLLCAWGNLAEAARWAERYAESLQHAAQPTPAALTEFSDFTLARIQIAQGQHQDAQRMLERLQIAAQQADRGHVIIEASLLLALADQARGHPDSAMTRLAGALELAVPEGFVRLFLDEGPPIIDLLARYLTTRAVASSQHAATVSYARHLLEQAGHTTPASPVALPDAPSARELEILRLLASGKSNDAIAAELFLARSTVKWHLMHLYRKLGVGTRVQAIARARALGLL